MSERLKIFFKLKLKEIWKGIKFLVIVSIVLLLFCFILDKFMNGVSKLANTFPNITSAIAYILGVLLLGGVILFYVMVIFNWISKNWKEAGRLCKK